MQIAKQLVVNAAIEAGQAIAAIYKTDFDVIIKDDQSPLTLADKKANDIIMEYLDQTGIPVISEENKEIPFSTRRTWPICWIVDPLDGTKEFINKNGEFTVNIALIERGKPIFGVIYVPMLQLLYIGDVANANSKKYSVTNPSSGLDLNKEDGELLHPRIKDNEHISIVGSRSHMNEETQAFMDRYKTKGFEVAIQSKGSSLKFCLVAEGLADIYPRFAPTMEWDTAAGQAICEACGIVVINNDTKLPLRYNKENLRNPWFIVNP